MVLFSEELIIATLAILFITVIVLVISHWVYRAQTALEEGRIRAESMKVSRLDCDECGEKS
ncbi:hypothetical protein J7W08_04460 [Methanococcoides orientis]|uniref:hypothetical protein n=1 Tax=Methanococcoides orientis TaxID=2822137 RepID=UPI001E52D186|nr:hypothetical protein [Methanococcoides orientis]UGV41545.1 hypothetical protein J7W08_04460 [Methanococcoides orientis]